MSRLNNISYVVHSFLVTYLLSQHSVPEFKCQAEVRSQCITDYGLFKQMIEWKDSLKFEHDAYLITVKGVNPY